jgi:metal-responsive CopG/Arc/MetJ family transcriptional regulator
MRYKCQKLVATHLPLELANELERIGDEELLSRSQILRDCVVYYLSNRVDNESVRSTRKRMLQGDVWGKLFGK